MLAVQADPADPNKTHSGSVKFLKLIWIQQVLITTSYKCAGTNQSTLHPSQLNNTSMLGLLLKSPIRLTNGKNIQSPN